MNQAIEDELRRDALCILNSALRAADASQAVLRHVTATDSELQIGSVRLRFADYDRISLLAVGKAAIPMAGALEQTLGAALSRTLVVTKHGHAGASGNRVNVLEAGHPIPDQASENAAYSVKRFLASMQLRDLLLVSISGGASALLSAPATGLTLAAKQQATELLLKAGADIHEINSVRKHLSFLKGGYLAQLAEPATVVSLLLSDVIGDPIDVIGSGLTAPDPSTFAQALAVLARFNLLTRVPAAVRAHLADGAAGRLSETPKPGSPLFQRVHNVVVGSNRLALEASAAQAAALGYRTQIVSSSVQGEAREVAATQVQSLVGMVTAARPLMKPLCNLAGGETTVAVNGAGKGGRNQEFALAAAIELAGVDGVLALSAGTDGTDGPTDAAGALATGSTVQRAAALGLHAAAYLAANDSYPFFDALGDLVRTGPTGTNVMDVQLLLAR